MRDCEVPRYPDNPDTKSLEKEYGIDDKHRTQINIQREEITDIIDDPKNGLIAIVGPCALTNNPQQHQAEGKRIAELGASHDDLITLHRMPPWKPRTNPRDWHGLETTEPVAAYSQLATEAKLRANVAIETGHYSHIVRYGELASMIWIGGRNVHKSEMIEALAIHDPTIPIGVKNGLNGHIEEALRRVRAVNALRELGSKAILIYRGGENALTPELWEQEYKKAIEQTDGRVIIDTAHGSEIAHDPSNKKSVEGQIKALEHVIELAQQGYIPAGIMLEASDIESPTDPVIPLEIALEGIRKLYEIKKSMYTKHDGEALVA